ncbi:L,D-transpeptidase family protein [Arsenicitalea aurantiaca]|nr:L,D-transpeptidase family protein [Arsenicitalea aurantiaca]
MKTLSACLLAGFAILALPQAASAQQVAMIDGTEVTRVVIAPPKSDLAGIIRTALAEDYNAAPRDTRAWREAQKLYFSYGERGFEPLWLTESPTGAPVFSPTAEAVVAAFRAADRQGLRPSDYLTDAIATPPAGADADALAAFETAFSAAVVRYAQHLHGGRIDPTSVSGYFDLQPRRIDAADVLSRISSGEDPETVFASVEPTHREYRQLKDALARYLDGSMDRQVTIPEGPLLRVGMSDPRVPALRERLSLPAASDTLYDQALSDAVLAFQESLGLQPDGVTGPATVAALNGGTATRKEDILANIERWRWAPGEFGDFHVQVNIPEFRLAIRSGDEVTYETRVVVGTPKNQTPVFSDMIRHLVVNPYWNVPTSIARDEIGPRLISNPGYLASQNMELLYGSQVINASSVNWSATSINTFRIRQRPGAGNALGQIKFLFPNKHDVYLHDTPSKALFSRSFRAYSHGCVRVQDPFAFADALMANEPRISGASLQGMFGPSERWVNPETRIPVHLTYFTLRVDEDGTIRSYGDVYGHNARLIELMGV